MFKTGEKFSSLRTLLTGDNGEISALSMPSVGLVKFDCLKCLPYLGVISDVLPKLLLSVG